MNIIAELRDWEEGDETDGENVVVDFIDQDSGKLVNTLRFNAVEMPGTCGISVLTHFTLNAGTRESRKQLWEPLHEFFKRTLTVAQANHGPYTKRVAKFIMADVDGLIYEFGTAADWYCSPVASKNPKTSNMITTFEWGHGYM